MLLIAEEVERMPQVRVSGYCRAGRAARSARWGCPSAARGAATLRRGEQRRQLNQRSQIETRNPARTAVAARPCVNARKPKRSAWTSAGGASVVVRMAMEPVKSGKLAVWPCPARRGSQTHRRDQSVTPWHAHQRWRPGRCWRDRAIMRPYPWHAVDTTRVRNRGF